MATAARTPTSPTPLLQSTRSTQPSNGSRRNLSPGDVFDEDQLAEHARNNIEIDDVYSERNILDYVQGTYNPGEVFDGRDLEAWAEDNGYVKE